MLYVIWIILGSSWLLLHCFFVFQLGANPGWYSEAIRPYYGSDASSVNSRVAPIIQIVKACVLIIPCFFLMIACYQVSIKGLGGMDWINDDSKRGLSGTFAFLAGMYLAVGIGRGIEARVKLAHIEAKDHVWSNIDFYAIQNSEVAVEEARRFASQRDLYIPCSAPGDLGKFADCLGEVARKRDLYGENFERLADEIIREIKSEAYK
mgnify:FL=1